MKEIDTDVVVVGAGLGGLATAAFLAKAGVAVEVIERNPGTSILPKARGQNPITMEALRVLGLDQRIYDAAPAGAPGITSVESTALTGEIIEDHTVHRPDFLRFSPCTYGHASQARAEEALAEKVAEIGVGIRFRHECTDFEIGGDGTVRVGVTRQETGEQLSFHARYLIAADGLRGTIPGRVGVERVGIGHLMSVTAYRFKADLRKYAGDRLAIVHYVRNPALPNGTGVLVSTDWEGEWVANIPTDARRTDEEAIRLIHVMIGRDDVEVTLLGHSSFEYGQWVASKFRVGPVIMVGDAAHVMPPTGGQGGNSAVQDGYYLAWRLAAIIRNNAGDGLLDQYAAERAPYTEAITKWQTANLAKRRGISDLRTQVGDALDYATLIFGYVCPIEFSADGTAHFEDPRAPSGRPGTRVPHVEVLTDRGPVSPRDLLRYKFMLLTANSKIGDLLARKAQGFDLPLDVHVIDSAEPLFVSAGGAVLVRPDGVVAWRGDDAEQAAAALGASLAVSN